MEMEKGNLKEKGRYRYGERDIEKNIERERSSERKKRERAREKRASNKEKIYG